MHLCRLVSLMVVEQNKNDINLTSAFPKADKMLEFEIALAAHAQKYHTGDWKWRQIAYYRKPCKPKTSLMAVTTLVQNTIMTGIKMWPFTLLTMPAANMLRYTRLVIGANVIRIGIQV